MGKRVYFVYTGVVESTPDKATIRDGSDKLQESQCLTLHPALMDKELEDKDNRKRWKSPLPL